jgi:hypothetical protein
MRIGALEEQRDARSDWWNHCATAGKRTARESREGFETAADEGAWWGARTSANPGQVTVNITYGREESVVNPSVGAQYICTPSV